MIHCEGVVLAAAPTGAEASGKKKHLLTTSGVFGSGRKEK